MSTWNRRDEYRTPADGAVQLTVLQPFHREVEAQLLDFSNNGFRVRHNAYDLDEGAEVEFTHPFDRGLARVIWVRRIGERVESGFSIVRG